MVFSQCLTFSFSFFRKMFQTKIALIIIILFMSFNILHICTPLPIPALDIPYVNKYFQLWQTFCYTGVFYHYFITVTKNIGCF